MKTDILNEMFKRKSERKEVFAVGILNKDVIAIEYKHVIDRSSQDMNGTERTIPATTKVIITMISRFGDVGIRDFDIDKCQHGYIARVQPEDIEYVEFIC